MSDRRKKKKVNQKMMNINSLFQNKFSKMNNEIVQDGKLKKELEHYYHGESVIKRNCWGFGCRYVVNSYEKKLYDDLYELHVE